MQSKRNLVNNGTSAVDIQRSYVNETPPYQRCMVMCGGGFRFGMYLGMYQAACDAGQAPDVLLAGCGGAIAAALIHCMPRHEDRVAWLASKEMHAFWLGIEPSSHHTLHGALTDLVARAFNRRSAPIIPPLFDSHLFTAPTLNLPFAVKHQTNPAIAIIGGRLLLDLNDWSHDRIAPRGQRKLFEETVFGSKQALERLCGMQSGGWHAQSAIAEHVAVDPAMPLSEAVKISVMDMFYFAPWRYKNSVDGRDHFYLGGVVDLFPIEAAKRLAQQVIFEKKSAVDRCFINPAWRFVLGVNGRKRQEAVYGDEAVTHWIDTQDLSSVLKLHGIDKKLDWRSNAITLAPPQSHDQYVRNIEAQVQYGYEKAKKGFVL